MSKMSADESMSEEDSKKPAAKKQGQELRFDHSHCNGNGNSSHTNGGQDYHSLSLAYQTYLRHDDSEKQHFDDVCTSYRQYAAFAMAQWANHQYRFHSLPESQRAVLPAALRRDTPEFNARASQFKEAAIRNQFCLDCILRHAGIPHSQQIMNMTKAVNDGQISKVSSVLKSLARDWSVEGKAERDMAYEPIIAQIKRYLPLSDPASMGGGSRPKIIVPGAGVGRLAFELTRQGYCVQGNDFSLYMLIASDFILNGGIATPDRPLKLSPWLLESRNIHAPSDPLRCVHIPDVDPFSLVGDGDGDDDDDDSAPPPEFSMAAGEFFSIYNHPREENQWDCVACSFFLDACPSIVENLQLIHRILRPGGYLINLGPLLYHWSGPAMRPDDESVEDYKKRYSYLDDRYMSSIDVCYEDVREILVNIGFEIIEERTGIKCLYTADRRSMMNMVYRCVNFVARKLPDDGSEMMEDDSM